MTLEQRQDMPWRISTLYTEGLRFQTLNLVTMSPKNKQKILNGKPKARTLNPLVQLLQLS